MKLVAFTLENYRSIRQSRRLVFDEGVTILVGPNNEGKSNILRAIVAALKIIIRFRHRQTLGRSATDGVVRSNLIGPLRGIYSWETDFPVSLQDEDADSRTKFLVEFRPSLGEIRKLTPLIGRVPSGLLCFELECGANDVRLSVRDANGALSDPVKSYSAACDIVRQTIVPEYIPSVRTAESAQEIVDGIVQRELGSLNSKKQYRDAIRAIEALQKPVITDLSARLTNTLREFLPSVKRVRLELQADDYDDDEPTRTCRFIVNDGTKTDLRQKGDGIQSLAAMSLMRDVARRGAGRRKIILAVEEPETHLHSKAIYQIRSVLSEIASKNQVIITTHNSVFVNRENIAANIIVSANNASPAENAEQIRAILGIQPSENLRHAELVLVVEGEDDRISLTAIFSAKSKNLKTALANGLLAIDPLHGSSNLTYKLSLIRAALCSSFVFVDNDSAGIEAAEKAIADRVLIRANVKYAIFRGKAESELEDFYSAEFCGKVIKDNFGVTLVKPLMRGSKKWSDRVGDCFTKSGQLWDDRIKASVKARLADEVSKSPKLALRGDGKTPIDALVAILEERLASLRPN